MEPAEQGGGRPSRGLGFSAIMLSEVTEGISLQELVDMDALSDDPESPVSIPGDQVNRDALGYMHVNCGPCHNQSKDGLPMYDLNLWLDVGTASPEDSNAWKTAVGVDTQVFKDQHVLELGLSWKSNGISHLLSNDSSRRCCPDASTGNKSSR